MIDGGQAPQTLQDLFWWGFNLLLLALLFFIRRDLKGIRDDIRHGQRVNNWLRSITLAMHTRCAMMHPDKPMPPIPEDPESRD